MKEKSLTTKDCELSRTPLLVGFPSCDFVSLVVKSFELTAAEIESACRNR
jgi:hypothetical protein